MIVFIGIENYENFRFFMIYKCYLLSYLVLGNNNVVGLGRGGRGFLILV